MLLKIKTFHWWLYGFAVIPFMYGGKITTYIGPIPDFTADV